MVRAVIPQISLFFCFLVITLLSVALRG